MNIAWNPPGLGSAIDRLMDFWDENVGVPMRRIHSVQPPQPEAPEPDANSVREHHERQGGDTRGHISALAALAGG